MVRLQHRPKQRRQADERRERQHDGEQPRRERLERSGGGERAGRDLRDEHERRDDDGRAAHHEEREALRHPRVAIGPARVLGQEHRAQRPFAEEPAKEVRRHEGERERVHDRARAEDAAHRRIAGETAEAAREGEQRDGAGVPLELAGHAFSRRLGRPPRQVAGAAGVSLGVASRIVSCADDMGGSMRLGEISRSQRRSPLAKVAIAEPSRTSRSSTTQPAAEKRPTVRDSSLEAFSIRPR